MLLREQVSIPAVRAGLKLPLWGLAQCEMQSKLIAGGCNDRRERRVKVFGTR